jgi:hypothetical protein
MSISGADRQVADPLSDGVLDGVRDRGRNACRGRLAKAFDAENVDFVPVRSSRARSMSSRLSRGSISRVYSVIDRQMHCSGDPGELAVGDVHALDHPARVDD